MPGAGPGSEEEQDLRAVVARHRVALVGLEVGERPGGSLDLAIGAREPGGSFDHEEPGVLLDLVVSQRLARIEADEDGAGLILALQNDRRASAFGSRDLGELPA